MALLRRLVEALERIATALEHPINERLVTAHINAHLALSKKDKK